MSDRSRNQKHLSSPNRRGHSDRYANDPHHPRMQEEHNQHANSNDDTYANDDVWHHRHTDRDAQYHSANEPRYPADFDPQHDPAQANRTHFQSAPAQGDRVRADDASYIEENVWLREKQSRITFNDSDLADIRYPKHGNKAASLVGFAGMFAMLGLVGLLAFSSQPELKPEEIIAMDGYAGEQPIKTPFNLASLQDCEAGGECAEVRKTKAVALTSATASQSSSPTTTQITTLNASSQNTTYTDNTANIIDNSVVTSTTYLQSSDYIEVQEIPAATNLIPLAEAQIQDTLVVLQQWSNVRGTPDIDGAILTALDAGKTVTKIGQAGRWIEVQVDERPSITGFMHRSTIALQ